jgi:hypothetical protein
MDIPETRGLLETRHIDTRGKTSKQTNMQHRLSTTMNGPNSLLQVMQGIDLSKEVSVTFGHFGQLEYSGISK